jgi:hypothetical protein
MRPRVNSLRLCARLTQLSRIDFFLSMTDTSNIKKMRILLPILESNFLDSSLSKFLYLPLQVAGTISKTHDSHAQRAERQTLCWGRNGLDGSCEALAAYRVGHHLVNQVANKHKSKH